VTGYLIVVWEWWGSFLRVRMRMSERGASLVEYAMLVSFIAIVCVLAIAFLGSKTSAKLSKVGSGLT